MEYRLRPWVLCSFLQSKNHQKVKKMEYSIFLTAWWLLFCKKKKPIKARVAVYISWINYIHTYIYIYIYIYRNELMIEQLYDIKYSYWIQEKAILLQLKLLYSLILSVWLNNIHGQENQLFKIKRVGRHVFL